MLWTFLIIFNTIIDLNQHQNLYDDNDNNRLLAFIDLVSNYKYESHDHSIFGPVAFAWIFYQASGGTKKNAPFQI